MSQERKQPIDSIEWVDVNRLTANDYNPNHVMQPEMKLLALSIMEQGWIQPILVWPEPGSDKLVIIDGFHRHIVTKTFKDVWAMTGGLVPVVRMEMTVPERMLLTIRINRAKGTHAAVRMHAIVSALVHEHGLSVESVCKAIGADKSEVHLLMNENVFEAKQVDDFNYTRSWAPKAVVNHGMQEATA